ncbi:fungal-specific transcription factor domain-containing protein, partial [Mycena maculata]
ATATEEEFSQGLTDRFCQLAITPADRNFFGPASSFALVSDALAIKERYLGFPTILEQPKRSAYWEILPWEQEVYEQPTHYVYPEGDLIAALVELYFTNVHPTFPVLHRPSFEKSVTERLYLRDPKFGSVLLVVLGVASRYSDDPRVFVDGKSTLSSGWKFISQVPIVQKYFDSTIYEVQFFCLMTLYSLGTSVPQASWMYLGLGIRFLHQRGEHRRKREAAEFENMLWNRAFWSFFALDRMVCAFSGRPAAIHIEDYDVEPPLEVDDEYWEHGFTQPLGKPALLSFFVSFVRLAAILGDALRRVYASKKSRSIMGWTSKDWEQVTVAELDSTMNDFLDSIPSHLRWDPDRANPFFDQSAVLYMTYYYIQITTHRPYIHKPTAWSAPSLSICTSAARSVLNIADIWMNRLHRLPFALIQNPVFVSAIILVLNLFGSKRAGLPIDKNNKDLVQVGKALDILRFSSCRWQPAGRLWEMLRELQSLDDPLSLTLASWNAPNSASDAGVPEPDMVFGGTFRHSTGNPDPFDTQHAHLPLAPGTSIEQLLADTAVGTAANGWSTSGQVNGVFDDEIMSMWMSVPTDLM